MKIDNYDIKKTTKEILIESEKVLIKQYLPTEIKSDLIEGVTQIVAEENSFTASQANVNALFHGFLVVNYSDIEFETINRETAIKVYDYFESNGYMEKVIAAIPKSEYSSLFDYMTESINELNKYKQSMSIVVDKIIASVPVLMERVRDISKDIDFEELGIIKDIYSKLG